jgi:hypothetical protein
MTTIGIVTNSGSMKPPVTRPGDKNIKQPKKQERNEMNTNKKPEPAAPRRPLYNEGTYTREAPRLCSCPSSDFRRGEQRYYPDTRHCTRCGRVVPRWIS